MARYLIGDVLELAKTLEPGSVDLIVSSPPFLAVRSYLPADHPDKGKEGGQQSTPGGYIDWLIDVVEALAPCLAEHGSLVFELGDTYAGSGGAGGDYADNGWRENQPRYRQGSNRTDGRRVDTTDAAPILRNGGGNGWPRAKSKSLIPELFRLALTYGLNPLTGRTTDRWILRNVITWCRPNPTPGALGDKVRPATSDIAVFTKSPKRWFDLDAERQPHQKFNNDRVMYTDPVSRNDGDGAERYTGNHPAGAPLLDWWELPPEQPTKRKGHPPGYRDAHDIEREKVGLSSGAGWTQDNPNGPPLLDWWELPPEQPPEEYGRPGGRVAGTKEPNPNRGDEGRGHFGGAGNPPPLDFWVLPPGGYSGAHYAVWPPELVRRLINLMCPLRVCRVCGEPSRRITEPTAEYAALRASQNSSDLRYDANVGNRAEGWNGSAGFGANRSAQRDTLGWSDCGHDDWREGVVLDPFVGSGTTLAVASGMGRESIGIDLDERNLELARERVGMFLEDG